MSANTVQPDPNRYDPALGDPVAPTPTSGNDEVEAMCEELLQHADPPDDLQTYSEATAQKAAALIRQQAAELDFWQREGIGDQLMINGLKAQIAELHMLLGGLQETYSAVLSPQMCAAIDAAIAKERQ